MDTSEDRQSTTTTCTSENDSDIEILPDNQNATPSIKTVDEHSMDTTADHDNTPAVYTPSLTQDALDKIIKNQPRVCLMSSKKPTKEKPASKELPITDQNKPNINNQPKVRIIQWMVPSLPEKSGKVKPKQLKPNKTAAKTRPISDVFPTQDSAERFKFHISWHILKRKYKHKYYFKCAVKECEQKLRSVKEWNRHHKTKHADVKYNCPVCGKVLQMPARIKDHKYTHNL